MSWASICCGCSCVMPRNSACGFKLLKNVIGVHHVYTFHICPARALRAVLSGAGAGSTLRGPHSPAFEPGHASEPGSVSRSPEGCGPSSGRTNRSRRSYCPNSGPEIADTSGVASGVCGSAAPRYGYGGFVIMPPSRRCTGREYSPAKPTAAGKPYFSNDGSSMAAAVSAAPMPTLVPKWPGGMSVPSLLCPLKSHFADPCSSRLGRQPDSIAVFCRPSCRRDHDLRSRVSITPGCTVLIRTPAPAAAHVIATGFANRWRAPPSRRNSRPVLPPTADNLSFRAHLMPAVISRMRFAPG